MDSIIVHDIDDRHYTFANRYWSTSRAWGHETSLFLNNGWRIGRAKVRYYNRTWERYTFQSCMRAAVRSAIAMYTARHLASWLYQHNQSRFKRWQKAACLQEASASPDIQALHQLLEKIG